MGLLGGDTFQHLIATWGWGAVALAVGLECIGIPVPAEATLVAAALHAGLTGTASIHIIVLAAAAAAIIGDNLGYEVGRLLGQTVIVRYGARVGLTETRMAIGRRLFAQHGGKVVLFGRFIALLRTLAALTAGITRMSWPRFFIANATGGILWACLFGYGAYLLGDKMKQVEGPLGLALAIIAAIGCVTAFVVAKRAEKHLEAQAQDDLRAAKAETTHP